MPKIKYEDCRFRQATLAIINLSNQIIDAYGQQGFSLTLRQLYYQLVSRNIVPNTSESYDNLSVTITKARYAGLVDWEALEDRTRNVRVNSHWNNPASIIESAAYSYRENLWATQPQYVEVWIEKDALVGVLDKVCPDNDVPYFSCRGYTSASEMWAAAQRISSAAKRKPEGCTILHLGDHDPSGMDMTRDIRERLNLFKSSLMQKEIVVKRIALTWEQIEELNPPPNPAKLTDTRSTAYIEEFGESSWELDALTPEYIVNLITDELEALRDKEAWEEAVAHQESEREMLTACSQDWRAVTDYLEQRGY